MVGQRFLWIAIEDPINWTVAVVGEIIIVVGVHKYVAQCAAETGVAGTRAANIINRAGSSRIGVEDRIAQRIGIWMLAVRLLIEARKAIARREGAVQCTIPPRPQI